MDFVCRLTILFRLLYLNETSEISFYSIVAVVSHIPQFGDAGRSPAGDVDVSAGDAHLQ